MLTSPIRQVATVYLITLTIVPATFAVFALGLSDTISSNLYIYGSLLEFFLLGFFPLLFAVANHGKPEEYGLTTKGLGKSLVPSLGLIALRAIVRYIFGAAPFVLGLRALTQSLAQPFPINIPLALFTSFTYGPLEVFYIIFLVVKLDQTSPLSRSKILSKGSLVGVALWSLIHLSNAFWFGLLGATIQVLSNFVFGLVLVSIFKYSKNSLGPMTVFTTANLAQ